MAMGIDQARQYDMLVQFNGCNAGVFFFCIVARQYVSDSPVLDGNAVVFQNSIGSAEGSQS